MKRTLLMAVLTLTLIGAKQRVVAPRPACAAVTDKNVVVQYFGHWSGCSSLSAVPCLINEPVSFRIGAFGLTPSCAHRAIITFGDGTSTEATAASGLPSFEHTYRGVGSFRVLVTVSNSRSAVALAQDVRVEGGVF